MTAQSLAYTLDQVIARIQELAVDGYAPGIRTYDRQRGPGLPGYPTLVYHGYSWPQLVELAGLEPAKRGGPLGNRNATGAQRSARFATLDTEVRQMFATAEPPRPDAWPMQGIPTREEIRTGWLPDGTFVRVYRYYYSLR